MKVPVFVHHFKGGNKNLLEVEGKLAVEKIPNSGYQSSHHEISPVIFFTIFEDFVRMDEHKRISVQFSLLDILELTEEIRRFVQSDPKKKSRYRYYSGGKENGKWVTLEKRDTEKDGMLYYLNISNHQKQFSTVFTSSRMSAVANMLEMLVSDLNRHCSDTVLKRAIQSLKKGKK